MKILPHVLSDLVAGSNINTVQSPKLEHDGPSNLQITQSTFKIDIYSNRAVSYFNSSCLWLNVVQNILLRCIGDPLNKAYPAQMLLFVLSLPSWCMHLLSGKSCFTFRTATVLKNIIIRTIYSNRAIITCDD